MVSEAKILAIAGFVRWRFHSKPFGSNSTSTVGWLNFYRIDSHHSAEMSSWAQIPRIFGPTALAFNRELIWDKPLDHPGGNVSLIPYIAGHNISDFEITCLWTGARHWR